MITRVKIDFAADRGYTGNSFHSDRYHAPHPKAGAGSCLPQYGQTERIQRGNGPGSHGKKMSRVDSADPGGCTLERFNGRRGGYVIQS